MSEALVSFSRMDRSTAADWLLVQATEAEYRKHFADRVLELFGRCRNVTFAHKISSYEHGLQTATRALRDGADEEMVTVALLHDVGEVIDPDNHANLTAALLGPYISAENAWLVRHHALFQGYYYFSFLNRDPNERDRYRDSAAYDLTVTFCERWDQCSFDPDYDTLPLSKFEPLVRRILKREPRVSP